MICPKLACFTREEMMIYSCVINELVKSQSFCTGNSQIRIRSFLRIFPLIKSEYREHEAKDFNHLDSFVQKNQIFDVFKEVGETDIWIGPKYQQLNSEIKFCGLDASTAEISWFVFLKFRGPNDSSSEIGEKNLRRLCFAQT